MVKIKKICYFKSFLILVPLLFNLTKSAHSQTSFKGLEALFSVPKNYVITHTKETIQVDGKIEEGAWSQAKWAEDFEDIEGSKKKLPTYKTQVKMLWNDSTLFIAAKLQDPHVWATQNNHDDIIYKDNDFEIFLDPYNSGHRYFEIEINAFNKVLDLFMNKPYRDGGDALLNWNVRKLKHNIQVRGTLNNPSDTDEGWDLEMAIPFKSLKFGLDDHFPTEGTIWRINFSRVQWDTKISGSDYVKLKDSKGKNLPEHNWVWSPQGVIDMHYPERWGYLQFTRQNDALFTMAYEEKQKQWLWLIYYRQKEYFRKNHRFAKNLTEVSGSNALPVIDQLVNNVKIESGTRQFIAEISTEKGQIISINEEGLIKMSAK